MDIHQRRKLRVLEQRPKLRVLELISVTHSMTPTLSTTAVSVTLASHSVRRLPPGGGKAALPLARRLRGGSRRTL